MHPAKPNHTTYRLRPTAPTSLSVRLRRHQRDLDILRLNLNSYATKVKKANSTVEQIASLQKSVEILSFDNLKILAALKEQKKSRVDYLERVARQFSEFHKLRRGVNEYVKGIRFATEAHTKQVSDTSQFLGAFQSESSRLWSRVSTSMHAFFF